MQKHLIEAAHTDFLERGSGTLSFLYKTYTMQGHLRTILGRSSEHKLLNSALSLVSKSVDMLGSDILPAPSLG